MLRTNRRMKRIVIPREAPMAKANLHSFVAGTKCPFRHELPVEENDRCTRSHCRANPIRCVDDQVEVSADARWNELVDRGIDRGLFTTDSRFCDSPEDGLAPEIPAEGRSQGRYVSSDLGSDPAGLGCAHGAQRSRRKALSPLEAPSVSLAVKTQAEHRLADGSSPGCVPLFAPSGVRTAQPRECQAAECASRLSALVVARE
jgi:hypothetical protein